MQNDSSTGGRGAAPPQAAAAACHVLPCPKDDPAGCPRDEEEDFRPAASWNTLRLRAELLQRLRRFFDERGFLEVETPLLSRDVVVDRHIDPLPVILFDDPCQPEAGRRMWLQTSPEFAMKRLMACGGERIYQVAKAFRGGERGRLHNPEFTLVEWYRAGDSMEEGIQLLADLVCHLLPVSGVDRLTYRQAFEERLGVDPHAACVRELAAVASSRGVIVPRGMPDTDRDAWLDLLLAEQIQPHLGRERPLILCDYPASQAALARVRPQEPPVAERFELFLQGVELANGYHELLDAAVLRQRNRLANALRRAEGKYALPEESRLLQAMQRGLPPCTGVALGFDRLVLLAAGAEQLSDVMAFPVDRA